MNASGRDSPTRATSSAARSPAPDGARDPGWSTLDKRNNRPCSVQHDQSPLTEDANQRRQQAFHLPPRPSPTPRTRIPPGRHLIAQHKALSPLKIDSPADLSVSTRSRKDPHRPSSAGKAGQAPSSASAPPWPSWSPAMLAHCRPATSPAGAPRSVKLVSTAGNPCTLPVAVAAADRPTSAPIPQPPGAHSQPQYSVPDHPSVPGTLVADCETDPLTSVACPRSAF